MAVANVGKNLRGIKKNATMCLMQQIGIPDLNRIFNSLANNYQSAPTAYQSKPKEGKTNEKTMKNGPNWIRTSEYSSQSAVPCRLAIGLCFRRTCVL